jgi:phage protein D
LTDSNTLVLQKAQSTAAYLSAFAHLNLNLLRVSQIKILVSLLCTQSSLSVVPGVCRTVVDPLLSLAEQIANEVAKLKSRTWVTKSGSGVSTEAIEEITRAQERSVQTVREDIEKQIKATEGKSMEVRSRVSPQLSGLRNQIRRLKSTVQAENRMEYVELSSKLYCESKFFSSVSD